VSLSVVSFWSLRRPVSFTLTAHFGFELAIVFTSCPCRPSCLTVLWGASFTLCLRLVACFGRSSVCSCFSSFSCSSLWFFKRFDLSFDFWFSLPLLQVVPYVSQLSLSFVLVQHGAASLSLVMFFSLSTASSPPSCSMPLLPRCRSFR
jgi:hypothetical protein